MGPPEGLGLGCIEIFRRRNISPFLVAFHFSEDPSHVVFGVAEVHQLPLVGRFENCVSHLFSMGQQAKTSLALR